MTSLSPARHLMRVKDLLDARYFESLDVAALARVAPPVSVHFSSEFRREFGESPHQYLLTRRMERAAALLEAPIAPSRASASWWASPASDRSRRRSDEPFGQTPLAYRTAHPPASRNIRVPTCVLQAYARPRSSTFGEDAGFRDPSGNHYRMAQRSM